MAHYDTVRAALSDEPRTWLVTGVAGFIGSNIAETLLQLGQHVVGLDNFLTGHKHNLDEVKAAVGPENAARFRFVEGDIRNADACLEAARGADIILHQAALGSVPRSIAEPQLSHAINVDGFVNMLEAARQEGVGRFVYASSSSVYGDEPTLPKVESRIGTVLSPYAATKLTNEIYADAYSQCYDMVCVGLRYFNVFGPRQDPNGPYAAVIPKWIDLMLAGERCVIFGDGETSRDFCFVDNAVQANILAALADAPTQRAYNVACGERTTLNALYTMIRDRVASQFPNVAGREAQYADFRPGDIRHSLADTSAATADLGYAYELDVRVGMDRCVDWYLSAHHR